jgi:UDP-glucose 4-epimerase
MLKWQPHFDDLDTIVTHALAWEKKLAAGIR